MKTEKWDNDDIDNLRFEIFYGDLEKFNHQSYLQQERAVLDFGVPRSYSNVD